MGKLLFVGDPHITHKSLDRGADLFTLVEERNKTTVWLGDLLDTKEVIRGKCLNFLYDKFSASNLNHIVLVGNHDYFNLDCEDHSLRVLEHLKNVQVIDKPTRLGNILFIPYIHDLVKLRAVLDEYRNQDLTLVGHLEVSDFDYGNGHICTNGLTLVDLEGYKLVVSGHFHKYQAKANLVYLGTPFSHSFGETNQTKYLASYDTETDAFELEETQFPRHVTFTVDCNSEGFTDDIDLLVNELNPKNLYRFVLTGTQSRIDMFPREAFGTLSVKWISRPSDQAENTTTIDENASNEAQFSKWAKDVRKLDEETLNLGLQILGACK